MADNEITVIHHLDEVLQRLHSASVAFLHEASGELESQAKVNTRVDTAQTKNAWTYRLDERGLVSTIGNPLENAIWEEFGTGIYALGGRGRRTPWVYRDRRGRWWTTRGKRGTRAFYRAYRSTAPRIRSQIAKRHFR